MTRLQITRQRMFNKNCIWLLFTIFVISLTACSKQKKEPIPSTVQVKRMNSEQYDQYAKQNEEKSSCKINKLCFLKNYDETFRLDSMPEMVYMDIEMFGNVGFDIEDLEAIITTTKGKKVKSFAYDLFYLDEKGNKTEETTNNNNGDYAHLGIVFPSPKDAKTLELYYSNEFMYDTVPNISRTKFELKE